MNTQPCKRTILFVFALLALMALTSLACSFSGPDMGSVSSTVDITLTQEMFDRMSPDAEFRLDRGCEPLDEIDRIELHDGFIRFLGTSFLTGGTEREGSFDLSLAAQDGMLKAEIVSVDIPGMDLHDDCIVDANVHMEADLSHLADPQSEVLFEEVKVEEGLLRMKVLVNVDL